MLFYKNPDISGMLKERLHLADSGKDEEVAKKVKCHLVVENMLWLNFSREKSKATYYSRREKMAMLWGSTTGEYYEGFNWFDESCKTGVFYQLQRAALSCRSCWQTALRRCSRWAGSPTVCPTLTRPWGLATQITSTIRWDRWNNGNVRKRRF